MIKTVLINHIQNSIDNVHTRKVKTPLLIIITRHSKESLFLTYINKRGNKDTNADLFRKFYSERHQDKEPEMNVLRNTK